MRALSIAKFEEGIINEDAVRATEKWIAISDGAGGGGVFAELWSKYLVDHVPDNPIVDFGGLDKWLDKIWEPFYNYCEAKAKVEGGMILNKFYDEGSYATLTTIWSTGQWISYGDSVAFCYNSRTGELQHSFGRIVEFNNPPYLMNCKDPLNEKGVRIGKFDVCPESLFFAASDTLAHYVLMMYELAHKEKYAVELQEAIDAQTKNSNYIKIGMCLKAIDFRHSVIRKLTNCKNEWNFERHILSLRKKGLIGHDDYSFAFMQV